MPTATVTSKGQITIPLEIRERYGIEQGTKCLFVALDDDRFAVIRKRDDIMSLAGMLHRPGAHASLEEMDEAIGRYVGQDDERIKREWNEWQAAKQVDRA